MTKYHEIIRLSGLGSSQTNIALNCNAPKTAINKMLKAAREQNLSWSLDLKPTNFVLGRLLFPNSKAKPATSKRMPNYEHIRKELLHNGVNKKLLRTEYLGNVASPEMNRLCIPSSAITSSRMSRSAMPLCISIENLQNSLK